MVRGASREQFVNLATKRRLTIWDVRFIDGQEMVLKVVLRDFFTLRPLLRETGCRMHVQERFGAPFQLNKLGQRKAFLAGFLAFFIGLFLLSSLVWKVDVQGNVKLTEDEILAAAKHEGIYMFQWSFRLENQEQLAKELTKNLPGVTWVGVEKQGTNIVIQVAEATKPEQLPLYNPRNLVASDDAVVTDIYTEQGKPVVRRNSRVKKGSLLISGIVGSDQNPHAVVAKGKVKGLVWHEYEVEVPLLQKEKTYTGQSKERTYLIAGNRALQVTGYGDIPFAKYEIVPDRTDAQVGPYQLPVGLMKEKIMEVQYLEREITEITAKNLGVQQAKQEILAKYGPDARVVDEKILHQGTKNGKVYLNILFEVEQWIMVEQPIVQQ